MPGLESHGIPAYEALSYVWGSPAARCIVSIHDSANRGSSESDPSLQELAIGKNLAEALRHLRYTDRTRALWIDALCIDQSNLAERGEQVRRMADIYSLAKRVVVWLGPEQNSSNLALSTLRYVGDQVEVTKNNYYLPSPTSEKPDWCKREVDLPYDAETWHAVEYLLWRPWFKRIWVCQEIQRAGSGVLVHCGHDNILWLSLCKAIETVTSKDNMVTKTMLHFAYPIAGLMENMKTRPWLEMMRVVYWRECTDERDKVYGVLGISPPSLASEMTLSYSLTISEVFKQATLAYINHAKRVDILEQCDLATRGISGPSWVPDWTSYIGQDIAQTTVASGISCASTKTMSNNALRVDGVRISSVSETSRSAPEDFGETLKLVRTWEPENIHTATYLTGESMLDSFLSIISVNCYSSHGEGFQRWKSKYLSLTPPISDSDQTNLSKETEISSILNHLCNRKFIHTTYGHIGISAQGTEPGK